MDLRSPAEEMSLQSLEFCLKVTSRSRAGRKDPQTVVAEPREAEMSRVCRAEDQGGGREA